LGFGVWGLGYVNVQSLNEREIIKLLSDKNIMKHEDLFTEIIKVKKERKKNMKLSFIRNNPRRITITYMDTGEEKEFQLIYSAHKDMKSSPYFFALYDGEVYKKKFLIEIRDI
jgi:hypothetical protein